MKPIASGTPLYDADWIGCAVMTVGPKQDHVLAMRMGTPSDGDMLNPENWRVFRLDSIFVDAHGIGYVCDAGDIERIARHWDQPCASDGGCGCIVPRYSKENSAVLHRRATLPARERRPMASAVAR